MSSSSQQRDKDLELARLRRLETVLVSLTRVVRLRCEGTSMPDIAKHMGWTTKTLYNWLDAAKPLERRGIRMSSVL